MQIRAAGRVLIASTALLLAGGASAGQDWSPRVQPAHSKPVMRPAPIDVNSAGRPELKTLPGIGDAEAGRIAAGRPYLSKADLVTHGVLPAGVYQAIRHRIVAIQPNAPGLTAAAGRSAAGR